MDQLNVIEQYRLYLRDVRKLSDRTVDSYMTDLDKLSSFCEERSASPNELTFREARTFLAQLLDAGYGAKSINRILSGVRGFYRWMVRYEMSSANPFSRIKGIRGGRRLPTVLTREEVAMILSAPGDDFTGMRDRMIFELLYSTGCRLSELVEMNLEDLSLEQRRILVHGKGEKDRFVFLTDSACEAVNLFLPMRDSRQRRFAIDGESGRALLINNRGKRMTPQGVHHIFSGYMQKLKMEKKVTPHTFRHSFATHILENDAGIRVVQELLGHENVSTTQIYSHVSGSRLIEVYKKSHPHG